MSYDFREFDSYTSQLQLVDAKIARRPSGMADAVPSVAFPSYLIKDAPFYQITPCFPPSHLSSAPSCPSSAYPNSNPPLWEEVLRQQATPRPLWSWVCRSAVSSPVLCAVAVTADVVLK